MTADEAERLERKRKKRNPDQGFSGKLSYEKHQIFVYH